MRTLKTTTIVSAAFLSLLLSACGGGSSSPLDPPRPSSATTSSAAQLSSGAASSVDTVSAQKIGAGTGDNFLEGQIAVTNNLTNLAAGGYTTLSVHVVTSTNTPAATVTEVSFISDCISSAKAILTNNTNQTISSASTINGRATINYKANGCSGKDIVYASATIDGVVKTAQVELDIALGTVSSIQFADASPTQISLKGSGGIETSVVRFKVVDANGAPLDQVAVNFTISSTPGGLTLDQTSALSNSEGYVSTRISAGTVATTVSISATVADTNLSTSSNHLVISTGIPVQRSVSLSATKLNPRAWDRDGEEVTLTMRMADDFGNPVPNNTAVTFWAEGGSVTSSCFTTNGSCSVVWRSQELRPSNGRVTILAFASGNESFTDTNANGRYDSGEPVENLGEAYLDTNESGSYTLGERFVDVALPGHTDGTRDGPTVSPVYNGTLCASDNSTICTKDKVTVRDDLVLAMSSASGYLSLWANATCTTLFTGTIAGARGTVYLLAEDENGNNLPNGTKLTLNGTPVGMTATLNTVVPNSPNAACIPINVAASPNAPSNANFSVKYETTDQETFAESFGINFL